MKSTSFSLKKNIFAFVLSFLITIVIEAILSIIFTFLPPSEWLLTAIRDYAALFSAFLAAFFCSRAGGRRGFLTGIIAADTYTLLLTFAGILFYRSMIEPSIMIKTLFLTSVVGAVGGIMGINLK